MDALSSFARDSTNNFFNKVSDTGYIMDKEVEILTVLNYIEEVLNSDYAYIITQQEYKALLSAINCLTQGSCVLAEYPFREYYAFVRQKVESFVPRITEDSNIRGNQKGNIRVEI